MATPAAASVALGSSCGPAADLLQPQLFLDDRWLAHSEGLGRMWHQPRKLPEAVLKAEHPWERYGPVAYGTVLQREGRFHMWYCAWTRTPQPRVCYAVSDDGVNWEKPELGLCEVLGSTRNNVVLQSPDPAALIDDISVIEDPEDREYPLKALYWDGCWEQTGEGSEKRRGIHAARSRDGIHWEKLGLVLPGWGDRFNAMACKWKGEYVLLGRAPGMKRRVVYLTTSSDLMHWSEPQLVLAPGTEDPPQRQFYSATCFPYAGMVLGAIERMHMSPDKIDSELIWTDDLRNWGRPHTRPTLIEWGLPGAWDDTWINLTSNGPLLHENTLWFFYSGRHGAHRAPEPQNWGGIGLATLRRDGFCSLWAGQWPGTLLTHEMTWPGGELLLNLDTRRDLASHPGFECGELKVEVRGPNNEPLEGYRLQDCLPMTRNCQGSGKPVHFAGERSLANLAGQRIRLFLSLRDTHLYSFRAAPAGK